MLKRSPEDRSRADSTKLVLLIEQNFALAEVMRLRLKVDNLGKMLWKEDKVKKMNPIKLISMGIHMGKKQYYKPS